MEALLSFSMFGVFSFTFETGLYSRVLTPHSDQFPHPVHL